MIQRLSPEEEHQLFIAKCHKEKLEPSLELFQRWKAEVERRVRYYESDDFKAFEKERIRRQQRTVDQTIQEDGAIISPINEKAYVTKRSWQDHIIEEGVVEVGNENANKKQEKKTLEKSVKDIL